jgi:hypothetical protein
MTIAETNQLQHLERAITELTVQVAGMKETMNLVLTGNDGISVRNYERITFLERELVELKAARLLCNTECKRRTDSCVTWRTFIIVNGVKTAMLLALMGWLWSHVAGGH